jgi:hypothetical protein
MAPLSRSAAVLALALACAPGRGSAAEVLAQVSADLNGDGIKDRAALVRNENGDDADLAIYLSANSKAASTPSLVKSAFGSAGSMAGTGPELSINKAGSLVIVFQNDSVGRDRWREQYVIAWRGGALVVAGYSYETRDTLNPAHHGSCDMNFLSGHGLRNGKAVATGPLVRLGDWTDKSAPAACQFD